MASSGPSTIAGRLTSGNDSLGGSGADETFEVPSSNSNLSSNDTIAGGGGHDIMLFERTSSLGVNYVLMPNVSGIEEFDVTASSDVVVTLDDAIIDQADNDTLCITFDGDPLALDLRDVVDPSVGRVEVWGTGTVTLRDAARQAVFVGDIAGGEVNGGTGRDTIGGGTGDDTLRGGDNDDILTGGTGRDSLDGGNDQDRLEGGGGNDTLSGGAGYDMLTGGAGTNLSSGGSGPDTFVVSSGETLTITDFDVNDVFERIDLRGLNTTGMTIFNDGGDALITLPNEGTTIRLTGVTAGDVGDDNFIFTGDTRVTLAEALSVAPDFEFTENADNFTGTGADEVFEVKGNFAKLDANDTFDGAGGTDVLRVWGNDRALGEARIPGISGIEIIDMSAATGTLTAEITSAMVNSSDSGAVLVRHGQNTIFVLTDTVADASKVIVEGTGAVTLRDRDGQGVTISDHYDGNVSGQNKDDTIIGGAANDSISGSGGADSLSGGDGTNTITGGAGNDTLISSGEADTLTGGDDTDRFVVENGAAATQTVQITDFSGATNFEFIDLRDFGAMAFGDLTITNPSGNARIVLPGGNITINLIGVDSSTLSAADFIFFGQSAPQQFSLTGGSDNIQGASGNDLIDWAGSVGQLDASVDTVDGGAGIDTLRIFGSNRLLGDGNLGALDQVEVIDLTNSTGSHGITISESVAQQSDTGSLTIRFANTPIDLNVGALSDPGQVILEGPGAVTLSSGTQGQKVTISDNVGGNVTAGNDDTTILGGAANDTITGDDGNDILEGNGGRNTISGGDGFDTLTASGRADRLTGGGDTDRFIIEPASTASQDVTITDFEGAAAFEYIDLTAFPAFAFGDMTIVDQSGDALITLPDGTTITLLGVAANSLSAADFVLPGQAAPQQFQLSSGADNIQGASGNDLIDWLGTVDQLDASVDTVDGGAGIDTLRIFGSNRLLGDGNLGALDQVEVIDLTNSTGSHGITISESVAQQSDTGSLTIRFANTPIDLNVGALSDPGQVILEGPGAVTLSSGTQGQKVTISDNVGGNVTAGNDDTTILGGAANDTITGDDGNDILEGNGGRNTISGGDGFDTLTASGRADRLTGGGDTDRFIIEPASTASQDVTITDFEGAAAFEYIDLTAFPAFAFGDMTIVDQSGDALITLPDGTTITLLGVAANSLSAADFVLPGQTVPLRFQLTGGADRFDGTTANDLFDFIGLQGQFDESEDRLNGRDGIDTLRIFGDSRLLGDGNLPALNRIEVIDLTNTTGSHSITLTDADVQKSDTGTITLRYGSTPIDLNVGATANAGQVILEGPGAVTLSSGTQNQKVTISDNAGGNVTAGNDDTTIIGGSRADTITGDEGDDSLLGNGGSDSIQGGEGNDTLQGGSRNDTLDGGDDHDLITSGSGANRLTGGNGFDQFIISTGAEGTQITDYEANNYAERIDLTALTNLTQISDLTIVGEGAHTRVTGTGLDLLLRDTDPADIDETDFVFFGQDPLIFNVAAGSTTQQLQDLFDGAPAGATINIAAGTYVVTETLRIDRGDITVRGAGEGQTIFRTEIPDANAGSTILAQPEDVVERMGTLGVEMAEGSMQVTLPPFDLAALEAVDPTIDYAPFAVGDLIFLFQENDQAWLDATGNSGWNEPVPLDAVDAENYFLREFRARIVSIDQNGVATLDKPAPYTFEAGVANVGKSPFLENVILSDFSIEGSWGDPDDYLFEDTMPDWASIAALELDGVQNSHIENITITDPAAHAFKWQRAHQTTADNLTAHGAHNKAGSSGYHFLLHESFDNDFDNLSSYYARHAVLFTAFNAEHYNDIHVKYTNRDINFHGSPDDENTIVVDVMEQDYPDNVFPQWRAVHPGNPGEHPESDIDGNDVTFKRADTGQRADKVTAHVDGAVVQLNLGSDEFIGQGGDDNARGDGDNDTLRGNGGNDTLSGNAGRDSLLGGDDNDVLRGGEGTDTLRGGNGEDTLIGGLDNDTLSGGAGRDLFVRSAHDATDTISDFDAGRGGDILEIQGTAYTRFQQLQFVQDGSDVQLLFGPAGMVIFQNTQIADLVEQNFRFTNVKVTGQDVTLRGTEFFAAGTTGDDTFRVSRPHMDEPSFAIRAGKGNDSVVVSQSSLFGDLGATGTYNGVEAFDLSAISTIGISIEDALVQQSGKKWLTVQIGDTGSTIGLDSAAPTQQRKLIIEGSRTVQLNGGRDHKIYASDAAAGHIIGDDGADTIKGGDLNDTLEGGNGRDRLFGALGDDSLSGGASRDDLFGRGGDDTMDGGAGADFMSGGGGSDFYKVDNLGDVMFEKEIWTGTDVAHISVDNYVMTKNAYVEEVHLKGSGTRTITGNQADTSFIGNGQDNTFISGRGRDTIEGREGADTIVFTEKLGNKHVDTIVDFDSSEGDMIHLDDALFTTLAVGALDPAAFHLGAAAASADDRIIYDQTTGQLFYDADGNGSGAATLVAEFTGNPVLAASDFEVI